MKAHRGQAKLTGHRYLTIALALLNATTIVSMARSGMFCWVIARHHPKTTYCTSC